MISEYSLNSLITSLVKLDYFDFNYTVTDDELAIVLSDFTKPFGHSDEGVLVNIKATPMDEKHADYQPNVQIGEKSTNLLFRADIHVKNPFDEDIDAAVLECQVEATIEFDIDKEFMLTSKADKIKIEFKDFNPFFKTEMNLHKLNERAFAF
mmetsp:Transcript_6694/g.10754  ORF Transcript_6694/g.10754 Transcript_6694/m.10754 type:complete len:152 (+) Transcript_6694:917-1372(+)